jgi:hypothetical protein
MRQSSATPRIAERCYIILFPEGVEDEVVNQN